MNETPKEKFLRNHEERVRDMRAAAILADREGRSDDAARIRAIADTWERIGDQAKAGGA